jgi:hypothetical protein
MIGPRAWRSITVVIVLAVLTVIGFAVGAWWAIR